MARVIRVLVVVALTAVLVACGGDDDLQTASELDLRVQELRERADRPAQSTDELAQRLATLWDWANHLSTAAEPVALPLEMSSGVALHAWLVANVADPEAESEVMREAEAFVARSIRELTARLEQPESLGALRLEPQGPFRAGEWTTLRQTWTVGSRPLEIGGVVALTSTTGCPGLQRSDAGAAGHVTATTSRTGSTLEPLDEWEMPRATPAGHHLAWRLTGSALENGDSIVFTLGDVAGGGPGLRMPSWTADHHVCPLRVDHDGSGEAWAPGWPAFTIEARPEVAHLAVIAPSVLAAGETFDLTLRSEDAFGNLASGPAPRYRVSLGNESLPSVPAGATALTVLEDLRIDTPGIWRFEVSSADGSLTATSNAIEVSDTPTRRLFWGDLRGHSALGAGSSTPAAWYRFARDVARLDFAALTEHDVFLDDAGWLALGSTVRRFAEPGRFSPLLAYQWSGPEEAGGHHGVYFVDSDAQRRRPSQTVHSLEHLHRDLLDGSPAGEVVGVAFGSITGDPTRSDSQIEPLLEIRSARATHEAFARSSLAAGRIVGFVGTSADADGHPGHPSSASPQPGGLTAVWADSNRPRDLFAALRARATYATTGERIVLDARLGGHPAGSRLSGIAEARVDGRLLGTAPLESIELVKNGRTAVFRRFVEPRLRSSAQLQVKLELATAEPQPSPTAWRGTIEIGGAELADFRVPALSHPRSLSVVRSDTSSDNLSWQGTGAGRAVILDLEGAGQNTEVEVRWQSDSPAASALTSGAVLLRLADLKDGFVRHEGGSDGSVATVQLQLISRDASLDHDLGELDLLDPQSAAEGDYYFLRVVQIDGAVAWSSPWWID
jgi:hypothetical protein